MLTRITSIIGLLVLLALVIYLPATAQNRDIEQPQLSQDNDAIALLESLTALASNDDDDDSDDGDGNGLGFGKKVAGTYVDDGEFLGGVITFTGTRALTVAGTVTSTNSNCCGAAPPNPAGGGNLQSIGLGNWKKTGMRQITSTSVIFVQGFDPDEFGCKLGCPVDGPTVARVTLVEDFAEDYNSSTGSITTEIFLLNQDFTDPDETPLATIPGSFAATRLPIIE